MFKVLSVLRESVIWRKVVDPHNTYIVLEKWQYYSDKNVVKMCFVRTKIQKLST